MRGVGFAVLGTLVLFVILVAALLGETVRRQRYARRVERARRIDREVEAAEPAVAGVPLPVRIVGALGNTIARSGLLSARTIAELQHTLTLAGFRGGRGLGLFIGSKLVAMVALPCLAWLLLPGFAPLLRDGLIAAAAIVGLIGPDYAVRQMRQRHLHMLERGLPDALDLLIICTEAGLSLGPAIARVASDIRPAHPAVAEELALTASELRVAPDSRAALFNAGARTGLDALKRMALTLAQSMQFGTPLSQALRTLSAEMRQEMLTRFEAQAARLPVLLTVPMILFILPCVFLIVGGPAIIQLIATLNK
ncbi:MAG: type II secretion system F family protein [Alphaproteobacteria bacterium]|nr:type II secretion system F family protein [Alphaproteobacteria bacterium]